MLILWPRVHGRLEFLRLSSHVKVRRGKQNARPRPDRRARARVHVHRLRASHPSAVGRSNLYGIPILGLRRRRRILMQSRSNLPRVMKPALRLWSSSAPAAHQAIGDDRWCSDATPTPGEVLTEVGVLLAIHLAVAVAVALCLRLCGVA